MANFIWVTFSKVGFHYYPEANHAEYLRDVDYLGNRHRHKFQFKVSIEIFSNNRELEFHQFLNWLDSLFDDNINIHHKSCEMLATDLHREITAKYPGRDIIIEVSEDGECGCTMTWLH